MVEKHFFRIKSVLEEAGYTVITTGDGDDVVDLFNRNMKEIDLLLLEVV